MTYCISPAAPWFPLPWTIECFQLPGYQGSIGLSKEQGLDWGLWLELSLVLLYFTKPVKVSLHQEWCSLQPVSEQKTKQTSSPPLITPVVFLFSSEFLSSKDFYSSALLSFSWWQWPSTDPDSVYSITESTLGSNWMPQLPTIPWWWHLGSVHKQTTASFPSF